MGITSASYNTTPSGGGHIPSSSPSFNGAFQPPLRLNMNYNVFGEGNLGPSSYTMSVGSMTFSLFGAFGKNDFSSVVISIRGNPSFGQQNPVDGTIPTQGASIGVLSTQGLWNPWQGSVSSSRMSIGGNPFHVQWNLRKVSVPMPVELTGGNPFQNLWNIAQGAIPTQPSMSNYRNQSMIS
jgi:hypothetical protein